VKKKGLCHHGRALLRFTPRRYSIAHGQFDFNRTDGGWKNLGPFYDSDREIEERCGVDIPTIFEFEGEDGFRERETRVIDELTQQDNIVLATGGGAVIREANRQCLAERGHVILLSVELKEQIRRVSRDSKRPLLANTDPEARLQQLWEARGPLYKSVADVEISTDSRRLFHVVNRILRHLQGRS